MPDMSGFEVLRHLRAHRNHSLPVLIYTSKLLSVGK